VQIGKDKMTKFKIPRACCNFSETSRWCRFFVNDRNRASYENVDSSTYCTLYDRNIPRKYNLSKGKPHWCTGFLVDICDNEK
jgi:hypothetical protein